MEKILLLILCPISALMPVITQKSGLSMKKPLGMKMLCVFLFLLVGLVSFLSQDYICSYSVGIMSALILGAIGDFILGYKNGKFMIPGAIFFSVGHIVYSITLIYLGEDSAEKYILWVLLLTFVLVVALLVFSKLRLKLLGKKLVLLIAYGTILVIFFTCAIIRGVVAIKSGAIMLGLCLISGGALFSFSDLLIGAKLGGMKRPKILHYAVSYTYFVAQTLFALSILLQYKGV